MTTKQISILPRIAHRLVGERCYEGPEVIDVNCLKTLNLKVVICLVKVQQGIDELPDNGTK